MHSPSHTLQGLSAAWAQSWGLCYTFSPQPELPTHFLFPLDSLESLQSPKMLGWDPPELSSNGNLWAVEFVQLSVLPVSLLRGCMVAQSSLKREAWDT